MDVVEIDAASNNGVDNIRALRDEDLEQGVEGGDAQHVDLVHDVDALFDAGAVSYTHLDVYKRQTRYSEHRACVTGDGQRRGARRDDGVSLSDERGPKNGFGKPLRNESADRQ